MNVKRITRLLKLIQTLQSGVERNAAALAKSCGVTRRTIFRDLEALRQAGVPLEFSREVNRYSIRRQFFLPPTDLTPEEVFSLLILASEFGQNQKLPFHEAAQTAALKLESTLSAPFRRELHKNRKAVRFRINQVTRLADKAPVYQQLAHAIESRRHVQIQYDSFTEWEQIATKLRPYQLLFGRRSWYVIGRSSLHQEVRMFNLARILKLEVLDESFRVPKSFDLDRYLGNAWHLIPSEGRDSHVRVRFKPLVAGNVGDVIWHKTQRTRLLSDGSFEFRATVSGLNEIAWWILGYGDQADVIQPARLRRLIAQRAQNMARMYNGST